MSLDVVVISGPQAGAVIVCKPDEPTVIGRVLGALQLQDPLVSLRHAELSFDVKREQWMLRDLGSVTGTFVDGRPITGEPIAVRDGQVIRIGESDLRLRGHQQWRLRQAVMLVGPTIVVVALAVMYFAVRVALPDPPTNLPAPAVLAAGRAPVTRVHLSPEVVRELAVNTRAVVVKGVSDYDNNGVSELWLAFPGGEAIVDFAATGAPNIVARLPAGCSTSRQDGWPDLKCGAEVWIYHQGRYRPVAQTGVVAWMSAFDQYKAPPAKADGSPPPRPPDKSKLVVSRVDLAGDERVAGFLARRGVQDAVHWVVCEGFHPGLEPQAALATGEVVALAFPCASELEVIARADSGGELWRGRPLAIALTPQGQRDLVDEVTRWRGGHPSGLFVAADERRWLGDVSANPASLVGRARLDASANPWPRSVVALQPMPEVPRRLVFNKDAPPPAPRAGMAILLSTGRLSIDVPGCGSLNIHVGAWQCAMGALCLPNARFVSVVETGCGADAVVLAAGYQSGVYSAQSDSFDYRLELQGGAQWFRRDMHGARLSWRPR